MSEKLPPVPHSASIIDKSGLLTRVWADWFQKAFNRMGGHVASTNAELTAASAAGVQAGLDAHISDTAGAHAASAISNSPSGSLAATNVQTALNELQSDVDTRATIASVTAETSTRATADTTLQANIDAHLADSADAHAASAITNTPSGNLAASDVQAALNELQTDIDTRLTPSGTSTLTNKNIDADLNTITNIENADIKATAAIARTKLAAGTAYGVVTNDASGVMGSVAPGTSNNVLKSNGTSWESGTVTVPNQTVSAQTAAFTASGTVDTYLLSGVSFTVTLPAAASNTGKVFKFKHRDSTSGRAYTIDGNAAETIDEETTFILNAHKDSLTIQSDGTNWAILDSRQSPTIQKFTSGSGTYTKPPGIKVIRVRMVGGGGGGASSGTASLGNGGAGGTSYFRVGASPDLLVANGGSGGAAANSGGAGGTASLGTGPTGVAATGGRGTGASVFFGAGSTLQANGSPGACSPIGGGGGGGMFGAAGIAGATNSGSGGGGGGTSANNNIYNGSGGGAGGYLDAIITSPGSSYAYSVGAAGTAGAAGTNGFAGGAGGSGMVIVEEFYQ